MEPKFQTSFIPKKTLGERPQKKKEGPLGVFTLLTLIVFLSVVVLAVGVFLYGQYLGSSIERKSESLERARAAFEPALIQELTRLNTRLQTGGQILNTHTALTSLFELLEASTLQNVQYLQFTFSALNTDRISLSVNGKAANFNAVALQSDIFGKNRFIREPIFSNMNLDQSGNVIFDFNAFVDPSLLAYTGQSALQNQPSGTTQQEGSGGAAAEQEEQTEEANQ